MDTGDAPSSAALCNGDSEANKRSRPDSTNDENSPANGRSSLTQKIYTAYFFFPFSTELCIIFPNV